jgi:hypothetical protein
VALTAVLTTNVYNQASAVVFSVLRHMHIVNKTAGAVTFTLYLGATGANAAGTELFVAYSVAANSTYDWYGALRMDSTDFLVGGASAGTSLTLTLEGELQAV